MSEGVVLDPSRLVAGALIGLIILLVLIIKFKVQAMVAILVGAISIGIIAGMPLADIVTAVNDGIGNTLKGIALLVGLGSMFGAILEASGGAQTLAVTMVKKFGDEKAAWALGITGSLLHSPLRRRPREAHCIIRFRCWQDLRSVTLLSLLHPVLFLWLQCSALTSDGSS